MESKRNSHADEVSSNASSVQHKDSEVSYGTQNRKLIKTVFKACVWLIIAMQFDSGVVACMLSEMKEEFGMCESILGFLAAAPAIALTIVSPLWGAAFQRKAPRVVGFVCLLTNCISVALMALSSEFESTWKGTGMYILLVSRLAIGLTQCGYFVYSPVWIDEFGGDGARGLWIAIWQASGAVGLVVGYALAGVIVHTFGWHWKWASWFQVSMLVPCIIGILFLPDNVVDIALANHEEEDERFARASIKSAASRGSQLSIQSRDSIKSDTSGKRDSIKSDASRQSFKSAVSHSSRNSVKNEVSDEYKNRIDREIELDVEVERPAVETDCGITFRASKSSLVSFEASGDRKRVSVKDTPPDLDDIETGNEGRMTFNPARNRRTLRKTYANGRSSCVELRTTLRMTQTFGKHRFSVMVPDVGLRASWVGARATGVGFRATVIGGGDYMNRLQLDDDEEDQIPFGKQVTMLLCSPIWMGVALSLSGLYFIFYGIQLWGTYYLTEREFGSTPSLGSVLFAHSMITLTAPVMGLIFGGVLVELDCVGGYRSKEGQLKCVGIVIFAGLMALLAGLTAMQVESFAAVVVCMWFMNCFGCVPVPALTGITVSRNDPQLRTVSAGLSQAGINFIGSAGSGILPGALSGTLGGIVGASNVLFMIITPLVMIVMMLVVFVALIREKDEDGSDDDTASELEEEEPTSMVQLTDARRSSEVGIPDTEKMESEPLPNILGNVSDCDKDTKTPSEVSIQEIVLDGTVSDPAAESNASVEL